MNIQWLINREDIAGIKVLIENQSNNYGYGEHIQVTSRTYLLAEHFRVA
ncbi:MAG: hypothetical protein HO274_00765 [Ferrovum myxofaciens]|nr:hypothetical protein [Ferrovum myxofaciens]QKE40023.1 MAG: hypothetical protein HO274_00765 [Ferrovum myxofaciens]